MRTLFKDPLLQDHFAREGYIRHEVFTREEIARLHSVYTSLNIETPMGFSNTFVLEDAALKARVREMVMPFFQPVIERLFINCKAISYSYLAKGKSDNNQLAFHQDWSFVDEAAGHVSINFWCPLVATSQRNGNLMVVPGTHELPRIPRPAPASANPYAQWRKDYESAAVALPTKLGEAIIYDNALFHGSPANVTDEIRLIVGALVVPAEATPILFYETAPCEVAVCEADEEFYLTHSPTLTKSNRMLEKRQIPAIDYRVALANLLGTSLPEASSGKSVHKKSSDKPTKSNLVWRLAEKLLRG